MFKLEIGFRLVVSRCSVFYRIFLIHILLLFRVGIVYLQYKEQDTHMYK